MTIRAVSFARMGAEYEIRVSKDQNSNRRIEFWKIYDGNPVRLILGVHLAENDVKKLREALS